MDTRVILAIYHGTTDQRESLMAEWRGGLARARDWVEA
jgi:hypothetical protein